VPQAFQTCAMCLQGRGSPGREPRVDAISRRQRRAAGRSRLQRPHSAVPNTWPGLVAARPQPVLEWPVLGDQGHWRHPHSRRRARIGGAARPGAGASFAGPTVQDRERRVRTVSIVSQADDSGTAESSTVV
jgi:hypothetical protein